MDGNDAIKGWGGPNPHPSPLPGEASLTSYMPSSTISRLSVGRVLRHENAWPMQLCAHLLSCLCSPVSIPLCNKRALSFLAKRCHHGELASFSSSKKPTKCYHLCWGYAGKAGTFLQALCPILSRARLLSLTRLPNPALLGVWKLHVLYHFSL